MKYTILYKPQIEAAKKGKFDFYAKIKYQMFPEMEDEYNPADYPTESTFKLEGFVDDNENYEYECEHEWPYGTISSSVWVKPKVKLSDQDDDSELKPLIDQEKDYVMEYWEPKPISADE